MGKCIVFSRVSTLGQDVEQQTIALNDFAHAKGYSDADIITIQDKESGILLDFEQREGISDLLDVIATQVVDCVVVFEISRVARRADVFYKVRDVLIKNHIQLYVLNPTIELLNDDGTINENGNLLIGIFLSMAESEMRIKKARFKRGKEKAKQEGRNYGFKNMFGYTTDKSHKCIIDERQATIVKRVFAEYLNGKSSYAIGQELVDAGYFQQNYKRKSQSGMQVCRMLNNEAYKGNDYYPRIISDDIFDMVQYQLKQKPHKTATHKNPDFWCKGIFKLEGTDETFVVRSYRKCYQTTFSYKKLGAKRIHRVVTDIMNEYYKSTTPTKSQLIKKYTDEIQMIMRNMQTAYKEIESQSKKKDNIWEKNIEGKLSDAKAQSMSDACDKLINDLRLKIRKWRDEEIEVRNRNPQPQLIDFDKFTNDEKFNEVHKIIECIVVRCIGIGEKILNVYFKNGNTRIIELEKAVN